MTCQPTLTDAALPPTGCRAVAGEASLQASPAQAVHKPFGLPKADNAGISAGLPADGPARNPRKGLGQDTPRLLTTPRVVGPKRAFPPCHSPARTWLRLRRAGLFLGGCE